MEGPFLEEVDKGKNQKKQKGNGKYGGKEGKKHSFGVFLQRYGYRIGGIPIGDGINVIHLSCFAHRECGKQQKQYDQAEYKNLVASRVNVEGGKIRLTEQTKNVVKQVEQKGGEQGMRCIHGGGEKNAQKEISEKVFK